MSNAAARTSVIIRCCAAYLCACVVCAAVQIGFVLAPEQLLTSDTGALSAASLWLPLATLHAAVFAAPFALLGLIWAERSAIRRWAFYAAFALLIAAAGWATQLGQGGTPQFVTVYVLAAALTSGVAAGTVYWAIAGRKAGQLTVA